MAKVTAKLTGGDKWRQALEPYLEAGRASVKVGILGGATYSDGSPAAAIAAIHEFGTANIPPRSFLRSTLAEKHKEWAEAGGQMLAITKGDARKALAFTGELSSKDIQAKLSEGRVTPALKAATVAAKAKKGKQYPDIPLVDTGTLMESISYEVTSE
ncbi:MAG: hypothetical protein LBV21_01065 [Candidatus Adiutrix sp.]|jgi:hypothetical protein|nr:hypothetical protein [Candidatus Adiutrix sp.]